MKAKIIIRPYVWMNGQKPFPAIDIIKPDKKYPECRFYEGIFLSKGEAMAVAYNMAKIEAKRLNATIEMPINEI